MKVYLNDKELNAESAITLDRFICSAGLKAERVIVELNGELIPGEAWGRTVLREGDRIFAVTFVGGG